jgi:hypothetical protein
MANDSTGAYGEPQYSASGAPADAADLSQIATYAAYHGTRIIDTTTARTAAIGTAGVRTGMLWRDTTDGNLYEYQAGGWVLISSPLTAFTPVLGATTTNPNLGTSGTATGFYSLNGKECTVWETFVFNGSSTSSGSGNYTMSLPFAASSSLPYQAANGIADNAGGSDPGVRHGVIQGVIVAGGSVVQGLRLGDGTRVASALAWATGGSYFAMQFTYLTA